MCDKYEGTEPVNERTRNTFVNIISQEFFGYTVQYIYRRIRERESIVISDVSRMVQDLHTIYSNLYVRENLLPNDSKKSYHR